MQTVLLLPETLPSRYEACFQEWAELRHLWWRNSWNSDWFENIWLSQAKKTPLIEMEFVPQKISPKWKICSTKFCFAQVRIGKNIQFDIIFTAIESLPYFQQQSENKRRRNEKFVWVIILTFSHVGSVWLCVRKKCGENLVQFKFRNKNLRKQYELLFFRQ